MHLLAVLGVEVNPARPVVLDFVKSGSATDFGYEEKVSFGYEEEREKQKTPRAGRGDGGGGGGGGTHLLLAFVI